MPFHLIGYIGGGLLGVQLIPQIHKVISTRRSDDISKVFLCLNFTGLTLMSVYGILDRNPPVYVPTLVSTVNTAVLYVCVVLNDRRNFDCKSSESTKIEIEIHDLTSRGGTS